MSADGTPWLDDRQHQAWRAWLAMGSRLPAALNRQLQRDSDLSLQDFDVLVQLTDVEDERVRVSALAAARGWERSRLSHHVTRMERRGLVAREECGDDGRGAFVVLTPEGRAAIEAAAPGHVRTVRSLVFDALTPAEVASLEAITSKVLGRLEDA